MQSAATQRDLPRPPWLSPATWRLPGTQPLDGKDWLIRDDAFAAQMALRDSLIANCADRVHALLPPAEPAARECLEVILTALAADPGYSIGAQAVTRPDGIRVTLDRDAPLLALGRLIQADVCLMQPGPDGHMLAGAVLCFPAQWTLAEKLGRAMPAIHGPVDTYDKDMARRVQRLFDVMRPGQFLWRANAILYRDPDLFTPKREDGPEASATLDTARYVRSERQVLHKLAQSGTIVFTIHTYMVPIARLSEDARRALPALVRTKAG